MNNSGFIFQTGLDSNSDSSNIQLCDLGKSSTSLSLQVLKIKLAIKPTHSGPEVWKFTLWG